MHYRKLGKTDIDVSVICLGSMTWGEQNSEAEAHRQLDMAVEAGVNFVDVAEMYPVPPKAETQGKTEQYLGTWLAKQPREKVVVASKITGPGRDFQHVRDGETRFTSKHIDHAIENSLKRLQTDYIDVYQLHWPDRNANFFGRLGFEQTKGEVMTPLEDTLEALQKHVDAGRIRHIGLSNETPWGVMRCLQIARERGWPPVVSVQNPYSLLNRSYEVGLAEISCRENAGLLAYSPLAFGVLSGKYLGGNKPPKGRLTLFERFQRYTSEKAERVTKAYVDLAHANGLDPAQMALAYVNTRPFVTANIIGATTEEQLQSNLASIDLTLSDEVLRGIEAIHKADANPCP